MGEKKEEISWVKTKPAEIEKSVVDLSKKGYSPAKIGLELRDQHGIPKVKALTNKRIVQILKEKDIIVSGEKEAINSKLEILRAHIKKNKKDHSASRSLTKKLWALQRAN